MIFYDTSLGVTVVGEDDEVYFVAKPVTETVFSPGLLIKRKLDKQNMIGFVLFVYYL